MKIESSQSLYSIVLNIEAFNYKIQVEMDLLTSLRDG